MTPPPESTATDTTDAATTGDPAAADPKAADLTAANVAWQLDGLLDGSSTDELMDRAATLADVVSTDTKPRALA